MPLFIFGLASCEAFSFLEKEEPLPPIDPIPTGPLPTDEVFEGGFLVGQFCDVQAVFQVSCVTGCHSGLVPGGGLDLDTNPWGSIVDVTGVSGRTLVAPGNPGASWLYTKMIGPVGADEGQIMPPSGAIDPVFSNVVYDWIANGAINDCVAGGAPPPPPPDPDVNPHPPGWEEPELHGIAANLQTDGDCRSCHGADLTGDAGVSCDECHEPEWRTNCTYCHGGVDNATGAPPEDIDGSTVSLAFPPHTEHVTGGEAYGHPAYGCSQCHAQRIDVLTPGHIFDDVTAGYGELDYTQGLSPVATYLNGTCSNAYCHGGGRFQDGTVTVGETMYCYSCHPDGLQSELAQWQTMSGRHAFHLTEAQAQCYECHPQTTNEAQDIVNGEYHVDGIKQVQPNGVVWNGATCTGICHDHEHDNNTW